MKFLVSRTSTGNKPCDGAYQEEVVQVDQRTFSTPEEFDAKLGKHGTWLSRGTNHRVIDGMITRDIGTTKLWFIDIDDIWKFCEKHGDLVVRKGRVYGEQFPAIEIYDDYRE